MVNKWETRQIKLVIGILVFLTILVVAGIFLRNRISGLLNEYMDQQVTRIARAEAQFTNNRLQRELDELSFIARTIEQDQSKGLAILDRLTTEDYYFGLIDYEGRAVVGGTLDSTKYTGISDTFRGEEAISGNNREGLLFTVPVYRENNVRFVLYKMIRPESVQEILSRPCLEQSGHIWVVDINDTMMIPAREWDDEAANVLLKLREHGVYQKLADEIFVRQAATVHSRDDGAEAFLFMADVGRMNSYLVGFIPLRTMTGSVDYVMNVVFVAGGLLFVILMVGTIFIFSAEEKSRHSARLREAIAQADQANSAKSDFLANMSHELRTPINAIMGMDEMILRETKEPEVRGYAQNIQGASQALLALVNDILDFSKVEAGKMEIVTGEYYLGNLLNEITTMISVKAEQKNLTFVVNVDSQLPDHLEGDAARMRQAILNLLTNAVKYTREGGVTLSVSGELTDGDEILLIFAVSDTGIGIKPEDLDQLFKNFVRLDLRNNRSIEGTGLGLALTDRLIKAMDGRIRVESEYGVGSTFTMSVPQKILSSAVVGDLQAKFEASKRRADVYRASFVAPDAQILAVDDRELNLMVVTGLLKETQAQITTASSGDEALSLMREKKFDIVLLDHMMPGKNGIETLQEAKQIAGYEDIPFIILTANAIVGMREEYLSQGFADYLSKPVDGILLEDCIHKFLPPEKVHELPPAELAGPEPLPPPVAVVPPPPPAAKDDPIDKEAPVFDPQMGLENCSKRADMYYRVLKVFCDSAQETKEELRQAMNDEKWDAFTVAAHSLKSSSILIGGARLGALAKKMEMAGRSLQGLSAENPPDDPQSFIVDYSADLINLISETVVQGREHLVELKKK